jgi:hypothetical protein
MRGGLGLFEPQGQDQPFSRRAIVALIVRVRLGDVNGGLRWVRGIRAQFPIRSRTMPTAPLARDGWT